MNAMELLDLECQTWQPKEGDPTKIVGELVAFDEGIGDWGPYPVLTLVEPGATTGWKVFGFGSVLKNEIERQQPRIGDQVGIKYVGLQQPKGKGKPYELFRVVVERVAGSTPPVAASIGLPDGTAAERPVVPDPFGDEPF